MKADLELHQRRTAVDDKNRQAPDSVNGLVVVFTGNGNGKSAAAYSLGMRALNARMKLGVVQFFGGSVVSAEWQSLAHDPLCDFQISGAGCRWTERARDRVNARLAWDEAVRMINDPTYGMVILDDITLLIKHQYLHLEEVMPVLRQRRPDLHVVVAGRYAPFELMDFADIVTEMRQIKHPHTDRKLPPQAGLEF